MTHEEWIKETTLVQLRLLVFITTSHVQHDTIAEKIRQDELEHLINRAIILTDQAEPGNLKGE